MGRGHKIKGIEVIGYQRGFGEAEPSQHIKSHWFDNEGNTFEYTYEVDDKTLQGEHGGSRIY